MRRVGHFTSVAAGALTAVIAIAGCGDGVSARPPAQKPSGTAVPPKRPFVTAGDNGQLRLVEKGFSVGKEGHGFPTLSYGLVLENLNKQAAAFPQFKVVFIDRTGNPVKADGDSGPWSLRVLPGGRQGFGATMARGDASKVADITVEVETTRWAPDDSEGRFTRLSAADVRTEHIAPSADSPRVRSLLRFTVDSGFTKPIPRVEVSAVFRDRSNKIVGGSVDTKFDGADIPPGRSSRVMSLPDGIPADLDDDRTAVYLYPSVFPAG